MHCFKQLSSKWFSATCLMSPEVSLDMQLVLFEISSFSCIHFHKCCNTKCYTFILTHQFPLPLPKGGKHANNPQLVEDQPMPQQRMSRKAREKIDILGMDFISGSSPFAIHDTTSRAAIRGISGKHDIKNSAYWNRRNPNQALKHSGQRK